MISAQALHTALSYTQQLADIAPVCSCGRKAELVSPRGSTGKYFWQCPNPACDSRVGCHKNSLKPFGTLANPNLRKARMRAHAIFDRLWRGGRMSRTEAYSLLQEKLGLSAEDAHIGKMTIQQCNAVVAAFKEFK